MSGSQPSICSEAGRNLYDLSEVCPWEIEDPPTPSEGKSQKHVSIAPGETTAVHRGSSSGGTKGSRSQQKQRPGQSPANRRRSSKGGERDDGRETRKPRSPRSPLPLKLDVSPWDFDEQPMMGEDSDVISPDRIRRKKSVTPTDGKPKLLHSDYSKSTGSLLQPPSLMVEICPWDYDPPPSPKQEKSCNSPTPHSKRKRKGSSSSNHRVEKEKGKDKEKSKERRSSSSKPSSERRRISQSSESGGPASGRRRSSTRDPEMTENKKAEVCPWEIEPSPPGSLAQTKTSPERKRENSLSISYKPPAAGSAKMADVCPWDFEDPVSGKKA